MCCYFPFAIMSSLLLRSADAEVTAPSWDFVSPKDSEYLKADLLNVIEANATMLKFDETVEVCHCMTWTQLCRLNVKLC